MWAQTISMASCLISTPGNSKNMDSICQANVRSYPWNKQTNKQTNKWGGILVMRYGLLLHSCSLFSHPLNSSLTVLLLCAGLFCQDTSKEHIDEEWGLWGLHSEWLILVTSLDCSSSPKDLITNPNHTIHPPKTDHRIVSGCFRLKILSRQGPSFKNHS